jgi:CRP/FNR family transcriptional regulator
MTIDVSDQLAADRVILPANLLGVLEVVGHKTAHRKGEVIHQAGDFATSLCIVVEGRVSGYRIDTMGRSGSSYFLGAGSAFGLFPLLARRKRSHNFEAIEPTTLIHVGYTEMWRLIDEHSEIRRRIFGYLCDRLSFVYDALDEERCLPVPMRLARRLNEFSDDDGEVHLTQQQLADQMGVSRVAIGNALRALLAMGFIKTGYRKISILDRPAMLHWSKASDFSVS